VIGALGLGWFALAFAIAVLAATVQCSIGFGGNLIMMPTIVLFAPELIPGSLLFATMFMNLAMARRELNMVEPVTVRNAVAGRIAGTLLGIVVLSQLSDVALTLAVGISVLVMVLIVAIGKAPARTPMTMAGGGALSGLTAVIAGIGGPPVVLLFQNDRGPSVRANMGAFFMIGSVITLIGLAFADRFGWQEIGWGFALVPAVGLGYLLSGPMLPIVDRGWTRPAILLVSAASALTLILRTVL